MSTSGFPRRHAVAGALLAAVLGFSACSSSSKDLSGADDPAEAPRVAATDGPVATGAPTTTAPGDVGTTVAPAASAAVTASSGPSISAHHQVIAQGLLGFGAGEHHWELATTPVSPEVTPIDASNPSFLLADVPEGVLVGPSGEDPWWRLTSGEAVLYDGGGSLDATAVSASGGSITTLAAVPGAGDTSFTPGEGVRDLDLVRDVLAPNEELLVRSDVSAFVVVTSGAVDASGTAVAPDAPAALTGDIILLNTGDAPATVVVVVIGPAPGDVAPPPVPEPTDTQPPAANTPQTVPRGTNPPATAPATTTTTTMPPTTTTTTVPDVDSDSDGLTDKEEAAAGTDPNKADTDFDGLPDGREVKSLKTDPKTSDTDSDGLTDGLEFDKSCDPHVPDTDGDGLKDAFEANSGFSECSLADTDNDGHDDLEEFSFKTDPRDPNDHVPGA